jgi:hypothetical protein
MPTFSTSVCSFCIWLVPSLDDLAMGLVSGAITLWMNIIHWNGAASWMTEDGQYFHLSHTDEVFTDSSYYKSPVHRGFIAGGL